jgi:EAL domain-containing protein (putative c-di-GMP-specific phosphodiesterase class I)
MDVIVLGAAFLLALAVSAGLYLEVGFEPVIAGLIGIGIFMLSAITNLVVRRIQAVGQLKRKIERMERDMARMGVAHGASGQSAVAPDDGWPAPAFDPDAAANDAGTWPGEPSIETYPAAHADDMAVTDDRVVNDLVRHLAGEIERNAPVEGMRSEDRTAPGQPALEMRVPPTLGRPGEIAEPQDAALPEDELVAAAIGAHAIDIYLQPIVSLADRRTRFYEMFAEVADETGEPIGSGAVSAAAVRLGLRAELDGIVLSRAAEIVTRLIDRGRARPFFVRLSRGSLADTTILKLFVEMMRSSRTLTDFLVFELEIGELRSLTAIEKESLASLGQLGFRFAATAISAIDGDIADLAAARVAFLKVGPRVLAAAAGAGGTGLSDALAAQRRAGIELVIEGIEDGEILPLAESYNIALGQGGLFSEPRPIKPDVLSPAATSAA